MKFLAGDLISSDCLRIYDSVTNKLITGIISIDTSTNVAEQVIYDEWKRIIDIIEYPNPIRIEVDLSDHKTSNHKLLEEYLSTKRMMNENIAAIKELRLKEINNITDVAVNIVNDEDFK